MACRLDKEAHPVNMIFGGPVFWQAKDAPAVMRVYRDYLPEAPEDLGAFVGLKSVPLDRSLPARILGQPCLRHHLLLQRHGARRAQGHGAVIG